MSKVITVVDQKRGCGWRKEGGIYLRADSSGMECGKLPFPLDVCPCCHAGIKPSRGWTWINPAPFVEKVECKKKDSLSCSLCVLSHPPERAGLLWVGEKFYPTPEAWLSESCNQGISRRIAAVPKDFKVGESWVFCAHRKCFPGEPKDGEETWIPGVFHVWKPQRIEYVTTGKETESEIEDLIKRGLTPVKVIRAGQQQLV